MDKEMTVTEALVMLFTIAVTLTAVATLAYYWETWTSIREYLW